MARSTAVRDPHALQSYQVLSFTGGLDVNTNPQELASREQYKSRLTVATNVSFALDGNVGQRFGMRLVSSDTAFTSGAHGSITGGVRFALASETLGNNIVAMADGSIYKVNIAGAATLIGTVVGVDGPARFAQYNDILVMTDSFNPAQKWDGTTWSVLGGGAPANPAVVVAHADRMFMTALNSSTLYWSKINNVLDWTGTTDAGHIEVATSDGAGNLLNLVSSIQELVLLKEGRIYRLQGVGPATGYTIADHLVPSTSTVGTSSKRAAVFAANTVWYASQVGVHQLSATQQFGDLEEAFASYPLSPYFRTNTPYSLLFDVLTLHQHPLSTHQMVYHGSAHALILAAATGSLGSNTLLVYDLALKAWSKWTLPGNLIVTAMWPSIRPTTGEAEVWLGVADTVASTRAIYALTRSALSDLDVTQVAAPISSQVRHLSALNATAVEKSPRRLFLYFQRETRSTIVDVNVYYDFNPTAAVSTRIDLAEGATTGNLATQGVWRMDLAGICEYMEVDIRHSQAERSFQWQGYEVLWRPRRLLRRLTPDLTFLVNGNLETWDAGTSVAPTGWTFFGPGASVARSNAHVQVGSYAAALTRAGTDCYIFQNVVATYTDLTLWRGQTWTIGAWVWSAVAGIACVVIGDGIVPNVLGTFHTGSSTFEWLTATLTVSPLTTAVIVYLPIFATNATVYFDGAVLVRGSVAAPSS